MKKRSGIAWVRLCRPGSVQVSEQEDFLLEDEQFPSYVTTKEIFGAGRSRKVSGVDIHSENEEPVGRKSLRNLSEDDILEHLTQEIGDKNHQHEFQTTDPAILHNPNSKTIVSIEQSENIAEEIEPNKRHVASLQVLPFRHEPQKFVSNNNVFAQQSNQGIERTYLANNTFSTPYLNQNFHGYTNTGQIPQVNNHQNLVPNSQFQYKPISFIDNGIASPPMGPVSSLNHQRIPLEYQLQGPTMPSNRNFIQNVPMNYSNQNVEQAHALSFSYPGQKRIVPEQSVPPITQFNPTVYQENPYQMNFDQNRNQHSFNNMPKSNVGNFGTGFVKSSMNLPSSSGSMGIPPQNQMNSSMVLPTQTPQRQSMLFVPQNIQQQQQRSTSMNSRSGRDGFPKLNRLVSNDQNYYQTDTDENVRINPLKGLLTNKPMNGNISPPMQKASQNMFVPQQRGPRIFDDYEVQLKNRQFNNSFSQTPQQHNFHNNSYTNQQMYQPQPTGQRHYRPSEIIPDRPNSNIRVTLDGYQEQTFDPQRRFSTRPYGY